uniref:DUF5641 domain-containing protein n=1 Tax=Caenorhabditis japonica TaxID=281687 RepID=A0A8R1INU5_CAEJA
MDRYVYEDILENTMRPWARANLGRLYTWPLGLVIKLHPSDDGAIRSATVRFEGSELKRPVNHLIPLEVPENPRDPAPSQAETSEQARSSKKPGTPPPVITLASVPAQPVPGLGMVPLTPSSGLESEQAKKAPYDPAPSCAEDPEIDRSSFKSRTPLSYRSLASVPAQPVLLPGTLPPASTSYYESRKLAKKVSRDRRKLSPEQFRVPCGDRRSLWALYSSRVSPFGVTLVGVPVSCRLSLAATSAISTTDIDRIEGPLCAWIRWPGSLVGSLGWRIRCMLSPLVLDPRAHGFVGLARSLARLAGGFVARCPRWFWIRRDVVGRADVPRRAPCDWQDSCSCFWMDSCRACCSLVEDFCPVAELITSENLSQFVTKIAPYSVVSARIWLDGNSVNETRVWVMEDPTHNGDKAYQYSWPNPNSDGPGSALYFYSFPDPVVDDYPNTAYFLTMSGGVCWRGTACRLDMKIS